MPEIFEWARVNLKANRFEVSNMAEALEILQVLVATGRAVPFKESGQAQQGYTTEEFRALMKSLGAKPYEEVHGKKDG